MNPQLCLYFVAWPNHNVIMKNANETIRHQVEVTANHLFTLWISHFQIEKRREKKNRKKIYEKRLTAHDKQKREKKECHRIFFSFFPTIFYMKWIIMHLKSFLKKLIKNSIIFFFAFRCLLFSFSVNAVYFYSHSHCFSHRKKKWGNPKRYCTIIS